MNGVPLNSLTIYLAFVANFLQTPTTALVTNLGFRRAILAPRFAALPAGDDDFAAVAVVTGFTHDFTRFRC